MSFLPKTAETKQELVAMLIALPVSLLGTAFLFYMLDAGARLVG